MSTSRVAQVRLRLRIPAELARSAARVREHVERELVIQILEKLELLLHRRFGAQTVIRIRRISPAWRIGADELGEPDLVDRLAADIADQIIADVTALPAAERIRPRGESFAVFDDDRHADAVYLADAADGEPERWLHGERRGPAATWTDLVDLGATAIASVVRWLRTFERLDVALALADEPARTAIATLVPDVAPIVELVRARAGMGFTSPAARTTGPVVEPQVVAHQHLASVEPQDATRPHLTSVEPTTTRSGPDVAADRRDVPVAPAQTSAGPPAGPSLVIDPAVVSPAESRDPDVPTPETYAIDTDAAGLFYLAGRVLEIELAERLWAAGLPEGVVLAEIAGAILGRTDDRAAQWFGGAFADSAVVPVVEAWAVAEVIDVVQHALGRRLASLGVALTSAQLDESLDELARAVQTRHDPRGLFHRLVTRGAASVSAIVAARLGQPPSMTVLRDVCLRPGRLVLLEDELHVVMSHDAIDLEHRRAGLDQDPGHVPWLGRRLRFEFVGADVL